MWREIECDCSVGVHSSSASSGETDDESSPDDDLATVNVESNVSSAEMQPIPHQISRHRSHGATSTMELEVVAQGDAGQ